MAKTAIITGASSGIGRQTAIALSKAGWNIVLTARRLSSLKETEALCPNETLILAGDITDEPFVKGVFETAVKHFGKSDIIIDGVSELNNIGRLDLLFNNAGVSAKQVPIENLSLETFRSVIDVNLVGCFITTREAVRIFKTQSPQGGRIINNGSLSAHVPRPHSSPYTCSKHAIAGLTKCTALDGRPYDITCTQIDIGNAHTEMAGGHIIGALQPNGSMVPEPTIDVEHVANTVVYIASLPLNVAMLEVNIMAAGAPYVGRG